MADNVRLVFSPRLPSAHAKEPLPVSFSRFSASVPQSLPLAPDRRVGGTPRQQGKAETGAPAAIRNRRGWNFCTTKVQLFFNMAKKNHFQMFSPPVPWEAAPFVKKTGLKRLFFSYCSILFVPVDEFVYVNIELLWYKSSNTILHKIQGYNNINKIVK